MELSWSVAGYSFNSRRSAVLREVIVGRDAWRKRARHAEREVKQLKSKLQELQQVATRRFERLGARIAELEEQIQDLQNRPVQPPCDLPPKGHQFGLKLMTWAIATAKVAGFRAAPVVMQLACVFFGIVLDLPRLDSNSHLADPRGHRLSRRAR